MPKNEVDMIEGVVAFLNANGCKAWRSQNTGRFNQAAALAGLMKLFAQFVAVALTGNAGKIKIADVKAQVSKVLQQSWVKVPGGIKGVSDVVGYSKKTGKWIAVEIKIGADRLSEDQIKFMQDLKAAGGQVYLCRDLNEFMNTYYRTNQAVINQT
jgi:hypothetical protein